MAVLALTAENLEATITDNDIVIIDFWAPWCQPCKGFGPTFEAAAAKNPHIAFAKCNTDEQQDVAQLFNVRSIPTVAIFREKVLLFAEAGALPASALDELIDQVSNLDMAEVHKAVAEQAGAEATS